MNTKAYLLADNNTASSEESRPSDRFIPWYIAGFFVVLVSVLFVFAYLAIATDRGVVTQNAYQKGLRYNEIIAAAQQEAQLPWQAEIIVEQNINRESILKIVTDSLVHEVHIWLVKPTQAGFDHHIIVTREDGAAFSTPLNSVRPGAWRVHATLSDGQRQKQFVQDIVVP